MKRLLLLATLLPTLAAAQTGSETLRGTNMAGDIIRTFDFGSSEVDGHPYLSLHWIEGSFRTTAGRIHTAVPMKFEAYTGRLAVLSATDSLYLKPEVVVEFEYVDQGRVRRFRNGIEGIPEEGTRWPSTDKTYLEVVHEGNWSLYLDVRKVVRPADFDPVFQSGSRVARLVVQERYLIRRPDGTMEPWNPSRRNLRVFGGELAREAQRFARSERVDFDNPEHLARLFEHVSALAAQ